MNVFFWYIERPLYISVRDDSDAKTRTKVAFKMRDGEKQGTAYLEVPMGSYQNLIFRLDDILQRTNGDHRDLVLQGDLDKGWFKCPVWSSNGEKITMRQLSLESNSIPLVRCLAEGSLTEYAKQWIQSLQAAVEIAAEALNVEELGGSEVLRRFFCPEKGESFRLGFYPSEGLDITQEDIDAAKKAYRGHMGVEPVILCFQSEADLERHGWFKFSTNPLGMYTTWVHKDDKERLEAAQTKDGKWERDPPTFAQARSFSKQLLSENPDLKKYNSPNRIVRSQVPVWRGQSFKKHRNRHHEKFLGESANEWAKWGIGWGDEHPNTVVAEWLNRIPNRFGPPIGHRHGDKIFGTKECNTTMMRAEAAVIELVNSDQFYQMLIWTESICPYDRWKKGYPRWIAETLEYRVMFQTADSDRSIFEGRSEFHPFSRRHPFRFEYELDRVLIKKCLKTLGAPAEPGPDANPNLLVDYEEGDFCSSVYESDDERITSSSSHCGSGSGSSSSACDSSHSNSTTYDSESYDKVHHHSGSRSKSGSGSGSSHIDLKNALTAEWDGPEGWVTPAPGIVDGIHHHHHNHHHGHHGHN